MKKSILHLAALPVLIVLLLVFAAAPVLAAPSVISVDPSNIISGSSTVITVTGEEFNNTAKIQLDGTALSGTVFVSDTELQVTIPADTPVGAHIITVEMDGAPIAGSAVLTVSSPRQRQGGILRPIVSSSCWWTWKT